MRIAGVDVRIHATFFLLLAFYGAISWQEGGLPAAWTGVAFILLLFFCVLLHEFGHAMAARAFGIRTPDITLLPIGGVARLERMPRNPVQELVIAVAGPAVNIVIALLLFLGLGHFADLRELFQLEPSNGIHLLSRLMVINIWLVLFNMIPAFPMDGGRVLRALLAMRFRYDRATTVAARVGQVVAGLFAIWGIMSGHFLLVFIAAFVFMGAQQELLSAKILFAVSGNATVSSVMLTQFVTLPAEVSIEESKRLVLRSMQPVFPVVDSSLHCLGLVERERVLGATDSGFHPIGELVAEVIPVRAEDRFDEAIESFQQSGTSIAPVVNGQGQLVGLVSLTMLLERARYQTRDSTSPV